MTEAGVTDAALAKEELRRRALALRRGLPAEEHRKLSDRILARLRTLEELRRARGILLCLSFDGEIDTWGLAAELAADPARRVYVPRVDRAGTFHVHPYPCRIRTLRMGLSEPAPGEPELSADRIDGTIDAALILGLAFDRERGYRLGHGKGHFDRFLAGRSFLTIGLCPERQMVDRLPNEPHDVPMRRVVTEDAVLRFGS